jgi:ketosteroid isomerase-like protein
VRRFFDAFDSHDEETLLDLVHPEVEFTSLIVEVEGGFQGHEGLRTYLRELFATFPDFRVEVDQVRAVQSAAVVSVRAQASGASSGVLTGLTDWQAVTIRDGKADWWAFFRTEAEARAAITARTPRS